MKTLVFTRSGVPPLEQGVILGLRYFYVKHAPAEEAWAAFCETRRAYALQLLALADEVLAPASPWS